MYVDMEFTVKTLFLNIRGHGIYCKNFLLEDTWTWNSLWKLCVKIYMDLLFTLPHFERENNNVDREVTVKALCLKIHGKRIPSKALRMKIHRHILTVKACALRHIDIYWWWKLCAWRNTDLKLIVKALCMKIHRHNIYSESFVRENTWT